MFTSESWQRHCDLFIRIKPDYALNMLRVPATRFQYFGKFTAQIVKAKIE